MIPSFCNSVKAWMGWVRWWADWTGEQTHRCWMDKKQGAPTFYERITPFNCSSRRLHYCAEKPDGWARFL